MRLVSRWQVMIVVLFTVICVILPTTVYAHAYVVQSKPTTNQTLTRAPVVVDVQFDERVQLGPDGLSVTNEDGKRIDLHNGRVSKADPKEIICNLPKALPTGVYTIHWGVVSSDGHLVRGTIPFGVGINMKALHLGATEAGYTPGLWMILDRSLFYGCMLVLIGLALFLRVLWPKELGPAFTKRHVIWLTAIWSILAADVLLSLPLQAAVTWNVHGLVSFHTQYLLRTLNLTRFGAIWIIQMLIILIVTPVLGVMVSGSARRIWWMTLPVFVLPVTKAFFGHAASHSPNTLPVLADVVHLYAASVWLGGVFGVVLMLTMKLPGVDTSSAKVVKANAYAIRQFSKVATVSVIVLGGTGLYAALLNIPTWHSLWHTAYGQTLDVKVGLFLVMVLLAASHFIRRGTALPRRLRSVIVTELAVGLGVLVATSVLTNLPTAENAPGPVHQSKVVEGRTFDLSITPNKIGKNTFEVIVKSSSGHVETDIQQASLSFASPTVRPGSDIVRLSPKGHGLYETSGLYLTGGGRWTVDVHILTKSYSDINAEFSITVGQ